MEKRIGVLEREIEVLKNEVNELKALLKGSEKKTDSQPWQSNLVTEWMIKLVYPGIYAQKEDITAGFPKNRRKIAASIYSNQKMFIYTTSPIKKIIGLATVTGVMTVDEGNRWPYQLPLKWEIGPKQVGISLNEVGIDVRPRPGDTLYGITEEIAEQIVQLLTKQDDLTKDQWDLLAKQYGETNKPSLEEAVTRLKAANEIKAAFELNTYFAKDGTRRGWDDYVIKGEFSIKHPRAKAIIWPDIYQ